MAKNIHLQMWKKDLLALSEVVQMSNIKGQNVFYICKWRFLPFQGLPLKWLLMKTTIFKVHSHQVQKYSAQKDSIGMQIDDSFKIAQWEFTPY